MKKLTPLQLFSLLICTRAFSLMTFLPDNASNALQLMLGAVISTAFQAVLIIIMIVFHKRFPNDDPCSLALSRSRPLGLGVTALYVVYFLLVSFYMIGTFTYFMDYYFSDYIPRIMTVISVAACAIYIGRANIGVIGKTGTVLFALFLIFTATLVISSVENFSLVSFHTAEDNFAAGVWRSAVSELARNSYLAVLVFLFPSVKGSVTKTSVCFLLTRLILIELILGFITMILGDYTLLAKLPFFALAAYSRTAIIERYDAAIMALWVMLSVYKLGLYLHCTGRCVKYISPKVNFVPAVIISALIPAAASLFWLIPHKWEIIAYSNFSPLPAVILSGLIPLVMIMLSNKRRKERAKIENESAG